MIGKSTTGKSFRGLANYLEGEEKMAFKETRNLAGDHKDHYVRMMEDTASMSRAEKPVYHLSISYSPKDNPSPEAMIKDGEEVLDRLGLSDHQVVFVAHRDEDYRHLHMMVNRVHPVEGKAWNPWNDRDRYRPILRDIEKARGYERVSERNWGKGRALTNGEYHQLEENGLDHMPLKAKAEFYELDTMFEEANSWEDVRRDLSAIGLRVRRKGRGGVIEEMATGRTLKLSRVDRNCSLGRLEKRFGSRKEFEQLLEAHKELKKHLPDKEIREAFGRIAREQFGGGAARKSSRKALRGALYKSINIGKAIKGLTHLASSSHPAAGVAKMGLALAKKVTRELNQDRGLGR